MIISVLFIPRVQRSAHAFAVSRASCEAPSDVTDLVDRRNLLPSVPKTPLNLMRQTLEKSASIPLGFAVLKIHSFHTRESSFRIARHTSAMLAVHPLARDIDTVDLPHFKTKEL
jgi:hypothetical protein